jgi:hypothetical protein
MARKERRVGVPNFGIGEWYGYVFAELTLDEKRRLFELYKARKRPACPFKPEVEGLKQPCNKSGGVCSFRAYVPSGDEGARPAEGDVGRLRVACPSRFLSATLEAAIAQALIGTEDPVVIREVGFLTSETSAQLEPNEQIDLEAEEGMDEEDPEKGGADVGRIDLILRNQATGAWCAVEHQAVYFSGSEMPPEFSAAATYTGAGVHMPAGRRRPDYRSSGPKRLMPQLQIKVPTLRRWGKKMAVVVDESFFKALGHMEPVPEPSNADIGWFIVELGPDGKQASLKLKHVVYTTLERAVEGLTAGKPVSLPEFERRIEEKLRGLDRKKADLVRRLQKANSDPGL